MLYDVRPPSDSLLRKEGEVTSDASRIRMRYPSPYEGEGMGEVVFRGKLKLTPL